MADQALDVKTETTTLADTDLVYALAGINDRKIQASNLATTLEAKQTHPTSDGTDHTYIDQDVTTTASPTFAGIQLTPGAAPSHSEGLIYYDSTTDTLNYYNANSSVTMNMGEEVWIRVKNNTGGTISNGEVCYLNGVDTGIPTVAKAQSNAASTSLATIGFATADITNGSIGYITNIGLVRDVDTSSYSAGDLLYLSADTAGAVTTTKPSSPNYAVKMGNIATVNATTGTIVAHVSCGSNLDDTLKIHNGQILESHTTAVTSNGTTVSLTLEKTGGGDLNLVFDSDFTAFDSTPAASVNLTAGSDTAPTLNYVFIPQSTNTLTANTTGFPSAQHVPVATVLVQSAASVQTDGPYKWHAWTDHFADANDQGHISHINAWIRSQHATWTSGAALTATVGVTTFDVAVAAGEMKQLHAHVTDAIDTGATGEVYMVNDPVTAYKKVGTLTGELTNSASGSMSGRYYTLVFWLCGSEGTGNDKLFCNLPSGSYAGEADAIADVSSFNNYSIPQNFKGTGILLAAVTVKHSVAAGGTWTQSKNTDLRGSLPSATAGGGSATGSSEFSDNLFRVQNVTDSTKELAFALSGLTTGTTRTLTMQDKDLTIADNADLTSHTGNTSNPHSTDIDHVTPTTTKGDIIVENGSNAVRLAVGTNGQVLMADSAQATGVKWAANLASFNLTGDSGTPETVNDGETVDIAGGTGITTAVSATNTVTVNADVGIADDKIVQMDDADAAANDYCKLTANGIEGRSYAEVRTDLGAETTLTDDDTKLATSGGVFDHVAGITLNNQTGTTYTLVLTDRGKLVTLSNASAITLTIPANASVAFAIGTQIELAQIGAGQVTVAITTDTLNSAGGATKLSGQYSTAVLTKITSTSWILAGDITT